MDSPRGALSEFGITVVGVVESFKAQQFLLQQYQTLELLAAKEELVIDIIEFLHDPVAPRFCLRDEEDFHSQVQAETDEMSEAAGVAIGASKRQFVVHLEVVRDAQPLPAGDHGLDDLGIPLVRQRGESHGIAEGVNEMSPVEAFFAFEVAGSDQVQLMNLVGLSRFQGGIGSRSRLVSRFDQKPLPLKDTVDGPDPRQELDSELLKLPLNGHSSLLGVLGFDKSLPNRTDQLDDGLGNSLERLFGSSGLTLSPEGIAGVIEFEPFIEPWSGTSESMTDRTGVLSL